MYVPESSWIPYSCLPLFRLHLICYPYLIHPDVLHGLIPQLLLLSSYHRYTALRIVKILLYRILKSTLWLPCSSAISLHIHRTLHDSLLCQLPVLNLSDESSKHLQIITLPLCFSRYRIIYKKNFVFKLVFKQINSISIILSHIFSFLLIFWQIMLISW